MYWMWTVSLSHIVSEWLTSSLTIWNNIWIEKHVCTTVEFRGPSGSIFYSFCRTQAQFTHLFLSSYSSSWYKLFGIWMWGQTIFVLDHKSNTEKSIFGDNISTNFVQGKPIKITSILNLCSIQIKIYKLPRIYKFPPLSVLLGK